MQPLSATPESSPLTDTLATTRYVTAGGVTVDRTTTPLSLREARAALVGVARALDTRPGVLLGSSFEYPGRYSRYDIGFVDPPLRILSAGSRVELLALNARGVPLLRMLLPVVQSVAALEELEVGPVSLRATLRDAAPPVREEERSRSASVFDLLRALVTHLHHPGDACLGLYGAFGYALGFRFEPVRERLPRPSEARDLVLYLADDLVFLDAQEGRAERHAYDFAVGDDSTHRLPRPPRAEPEAGSDSPRGTRLGAIESDHAPEEFEAGVRRALEAFGRGDLFEVVLSQTFRVQTDVRPSDLFEALRTLNPAPYGFLMNLDQGEHLVGASPEMFVRVRGRTVETCPIAGTIARGADALEDAARVRTLLNDVKEEDELTMCTDVDRNDKARICEPGSVRVIGRRQVEMYSRVMHTVDHVVGTLCAERDALDAFLAHTWAVTVTGAPKPDALQFIEDHEKTARGFYSGAVGAVLFNGDLNTGLTLRTARLHAGQVEVRAGATLLHASEPEKEARECVLKASAVFDALALATRPPSRAPSPARPTPLPAVRVLLVDHRDSFVHTLADYLRQAGAQVTTLRAGFDPGRIQAHAPDLLVLSPGPGRPNDFGCREVLDAAAKAECAVFGVCLGLQALVEHAGGHLDRLPTPRHGSSSLIADLKGPLFDGFPPVFRAGRYHSLHAATLDGSFPASLRITALGPRETLECGGVLREGCVVMAVSHETRPWHAVQFHPESITTDRGMGMRLLGNALRVGARHAQAAVA